jgi:peptide deformylase
MALLKIARMGHPVLRARAAAVDDPTAPWVKALARDMIETMHDAGGTGLAAPQVHQPHRIVVFMVGEERLSGLPGDVPQPLTATSLDGATIEREVAGFHARVVQHECDHLDGVLYPQRMTDLRLLFFLEELQRHPIDLSACLGGEPSG